MSDNEDVICDPLDLSNHITETANNLEIPLSANSRIYVLELVLPTLDELFRMVLRDLVVGKTFEITSIEFI
jgi:hypothetical protein